MQLTFGPLRLRIYVWENREIMTLNAVACVRLEWLCEDWGAIETAGSNLDTLLSGWIVEHIHTRISWKT